MITRFVLSTNQNKRRQSKGSDKVCTRPDAGGNCDQGGLNRLGDS